MKNLLLIVFVAFSAAAFSQDIITKRNGEEIEAKVLKVGESEVEYKKFSNPDGPSYTERKANIFMIKYKNGDKDVFDSTPSVATSETKPVQNVSEPKAMPEKNNALISSYNTPISYIDNDTDKGANWAFCTLGVSPESVLCNEDLEIEISGNNSYLDDPGLRIVVTNTSEHNIFVDLSKTFWIQKSETWSFYDNTVVVKSHGGSTGGSINLGSVTSALGVGGPLGTLAGGVNVGGSSNNSTTTIETKQQILIIPPHSSTRMDWVGLDYTRQKDKKGRTKFTEACPYPFMGYYLEPPHRRFNLGNNPRRGNYASYTPEDSPMEYFFILNYSNDENSAQSFVMKSRLFLKDVVAVHAGFWSGVVSNETINGFDDVKLRFFMGIMDKKKDIKNRSVLPR